VPRRSALWNRIRLYCTSQSAADLFPDLPISGTGADIQAYAAAKSLPLFQFAGFELEQMMLLNKRIREDTFAFLARKGVKYIPSETNFFMMEVNRPGNQFADAMAANKVVIGRIWPGSTMHLELPEHQAAEGPFQIKDDVLTTPGQNASQYRFRRY